MPGSDPRGEDRALERVKAWLEDQDREMNDAIDAEDCGPDDYTYIEVLTADLRDLIARASAPPAPISLLERVVGALEVAQYLFAHGVGAMTDNGDKANQDRNLDAAKNIGAHLSSVLAEVREAISSRTDLSAHALSSAETEASKKRAQASSAQEGPIYNTDPIRYSDTGQAGAQENRYE